MSNDQIPSKITRFDGAPGGSRTHDHRLRRPGRDVPVCPAVRTKKHASTSEQMRGATGCGRSDTKPNFV